MPPAIVLVPGAFAESSSWNRVIDLFPAEHRVIAAANPLRSLAADAESVSDLVPRSDGTTDLYIARERFHDQFAADVPAPEAAHMAATQRRRLTVPDASVRRPQFTKDQDMRTVVARGPARDPRRRRGPRTGRRAERAAGPHPRSQRNRKISHA